MQSRVSVVIPVWNQAHLISNAIGSILDQTIDEWDMVIVNDGSMDNIREVVSKFEDQRIKLINIEHKGMVFARNLGNTHAKADIIAFQDADDLSMPNRLKRCLEAIQDADVLYHGLYVNMWDNLNGRIHRKYVPAKPFDKKELLKHQYIPGVCVFRKKVWENKPFRYETEGSFDHMMHLDWAFSNYRYKALDEGLYEYVRHVGSYSISSEKQGKRKESLKKINEILEQEYASKLDPDTE